MRRLAALVALLLALLGASVPARAAVTIDFYSHELTLVARGLNTYFPHALVILRGTTEDGTPVNANLGFTAKTVFINILWQKVTGEMDPTPLPQGYLEGADRRFSFTLTDAQYRAVLAVADRWRNAPQPSYDIDETNCVTFIREIARTVGLSVSDERRFVRAPSTDWNSVRKGVESKFLYFPDENHWVLKPNNSVQWHDTVNGWLKQHIGQ